MTTPPSVERILPVTAAQRGIFLHHLAHPGSAAYHTAIAFVLVDGGDHETLAEAVRRVADVHPLLRSRFVLTDAWTVVRVEGSVSTVAMDRGMPGPGDLAASDETVAAVAVAAPVDLQQGAFRVVVIPRSDGDLVVVVGHHIATDAHANAVLLADLLGAYAALLAGRPWPAELAMVSAHNGMDEAEPSVDDPRIVAALERLRGHWGEAVIAELPLDRPRSPDTGTSGRTVRRRLGDTTAAAVVRTAAMLEVTPFAVLLGSFAVVIWDYVREPAFLLGVPMSRRTNRRSARAVGNYVNLAAVRAEVHRTDSVRTVVQRVAAAARESYLAVAVPYAALLASGALPRPRSGGIGVRISVNLIGSVHLDELTDAFLRCDGTTVSHEGVRVRPVAVPQSEGQLDLTIQVQWSKTGLLLDLRYDDTVLDEESVAVVADRVVRILELAVTDPERTVATLLRESAH